MFTLKYSNQVEKFIRKLHDSDFILKFEELKSRLTTNPHPAQDYDFKKIDDQKYRVRIGQYRVIYKIRNQELLILILKVELKDDNTYK